MASARLIIDPPRPGPENMARDEALLRAAADPHHEVTVRFYAWDPPTLSLGYFQAFSEYQCLPPPAGGLSVVRRTTGGGAILHDLEVTYSIAIPLGHPLVAGDPNRLYRLAHQAIIAAVGPAARLCEAVLGPARRCSSEPRPSGNGLSASPEPLPHGRGSDRNQLGAVQRGPFFCFTRRHPLDVVVTDPAQPDGVSKLAGSAQRRTQTMILQHGSLMLENRFPQQLTAHWASLEGPADFAAAARRLIPEFERQLGLELVAASWRGEEKDLVPAFRERYGGADWTERRICERPVSS